MGWQQSMIVLFLALESCTCIRVEVPVQDYEKKYPGTSLELGDCPLREVFDLQGKPNVEKCFDKKVTGRTEFIPAGGYESTSLQIQSHEDLTTHIMGGLSVGVGLMGLIGASVKVNVGVQTQTNKRQLTLMSGYTLTRGIQSLRDPRGSAGSLYLSEVELGAQETLLVSMEFQDDKTRVEVEGTLTIKVLFIPISAKIGFVVEKFGSNASCTITFLSSWREARTISLQGANALKRAVWEVEKIEDLMMKGPQEVLSLPRTDKRLRRTFTFTASNISSPENKINEALIGRQLELLNQQELELEAVLYRVNLYLKSGEMAYHMSGDIRMKLTDFQTGVKERRDQLVKGLRTFFQLNSKERAGLRGIYGEIRVPGYYWRTLDRIWVPPAGVSVMEAQWKLAESRASQTGRSVADEVFFHSVVP